MEERERGCDIPVDGIMLEVLLPCILSGGATIDHAVFSTISAGGHLKVVGDTNVVGKVVT